MVSTPPRPSSHREVGKFNWSHDVAKLAGAYVSTASRIWNGRQDANVREAVGADFEIMVDVGYAWTDWRYALSIIETWAPYDVFFVVTPLWTDDIDGYASLKKHSPIPIAAVEWLSHHREFQQYVDRNALDVLQP